MQKKINDEYSRIKIRRSINNRFKKIAIQLSTDMNVVFVQDIVELALLTYLDDKDKE